MKRPLYIEIIIEIITVVIGLLLMPVMIHAQSGTNNPPIEQPLIREGDFAVKLVSALELGATEDEVEAEDLLSSFGITPRNGWIADYPVTPDILGEIRESVLAAADSQKLSMSQDEALKRFQDAKADVGLEIRAYTSGETHELDQSSSYPETSVINNYYYDQGPPIVTYYAPPPYYYYLYAWVPYPFWWYNSWFPGYFILHDFHRTVHFHHRSVFVSNHFNDDRRHRVYRIDPVDRFHGKTFAGIGAPRSKSFLSTGVKGGSESIFNRNRTSPPTVKTLRTPPGGRQSGPPSGGKSFRSPGPPSGDKSFKSPGPPPGGRTVSPPAGVRSPGPSSGGRSLQQPQGGMPSGPHPGGRSGSPGGGQRR